MDIHSQNSNSFDEAKKFIKEADCKRHLKKLGEEIFIYEDGFALASDGEAIYEAETPAEVRVFVAYFTARKQRVASLASLAKDAFKPATIKFAGAAQFEIK